MLHSSTEHTSSAESQFSSLNRHSPAFEKIACFRSLFRGRTDVYPQRFESRKTGRAGYSPACGNEWVRGICEKPKIKCFRCAHQNWLPVNDRIIRWHLSGKDSQGRDFIMGVYPMLLDESCHLLTIDLDGETWQDDALALAEGVQRLGLPLALERSRSGKGAHFWFFFNRAVSAIKARKLGMHLLTEAMEQRPEVGLASYDRLFPNQDTLPKGGFGNLIALPLQKAARQAGNSVFVDLNFESYQDQWSFLGSLEKIAVETLSNILARAESANRILPVRNAPADEFALTPWEVPPSRRVKETPITEPLPTSITIVLSDQIYIPKDVLPPSLRNRILHLAAFQNPEFYRAQAMRLPTYDKPQVIACAEEHPEHIALPRGCLEDLRALLKRHNVPLNLEDRRQRGTRLQVEFRGELRPEQKTAAHALLPHETGVLAATTAFGKTVLAAWMIAQRGVNTLVLVHRQQLMAQWVERLSAFLDFPQKSIGCLGGGRRKLKGQIDVALMQSLVRKNVVDDRIANYGHLIVDECHHLPAQSFEKAVRRAKATYVLGLSATVQRKDGHHPILFMQCGPVRHQVNAKEQAAVRPFQHQVIVRPTSFRSIHEPEEDARGEYQELCRSLMGDQDRNTLICEDVVAAVQAGRYPLVLTERTEHVDTLHTRLASNGLSAITLKGGMAKRKLAAAVKAVQANNGAPDVILATGRFVGEGFDCSRLDTLFVTMPVSWRGTVAQYVGRLHRLHDRKQVVQVYDYADLNEPMLARMFDKRCAGYEAVGYSILLPANALPGWPQSVPLPIDPVWKKDYASSVKRLVLDGVDAALADLFVHAANPHSNRKGARSASEAFFHKRLESLPETRKRFQLNAELPIPFNQRGTMEVDFFCEEANLVMELDGAQHLQDEAAWRSDRQKDRLLQLHGYVIIRFLATDIAKQLTTVLDTVLTTLDHCDRERKQTNG